jgi:hypothetical protein
VAVGTATSCVTCEVEQTVTLTTALATDSRGNPRVVKLVSRAATKLIAFVAERAEKGFIEFVHSHILTRTTDTIQELGKKFLNS